MFAENQLVELFSWGQIDSMQIRNRTFMPPRATVFASDNCVTERHLDFYGERAKRGVGLVIVKQTSVELYCVKGRVN